MNPELLAPAGCFDTALAAFEAGADAVYLGLPSFSARASAANFSFDDLRRLLSYAHGGGAGSRKIYVAFNTLLSDAELPGAVESLARLDDLKPDALIVQDLGVARICRRNFPNLRLHASTQLVAHNLEGVAALRELGFERVVLARELPIDDVRAICRDGGVEIETFVHGALCYSLSGLCLFSAMEKNRSGNRGRCAYCCRLAYADATGRTGLPFSMKDLRLDEEVDALREAGVASLKIEGRMKSALYVASATKYYREILDGAERSVSREDLETVFSRHVTKLYAHGWDSGETPVDPDSLGHVGAKVGVVKRITRDREGRAWLRFHTSRDLERHDGLQFLRPRQAADANGDVKPAGFGISDMRTALSRRTAFEVAAGADVEVLLPDPPPDPPPQPGDVVCCAMSNAVKRRFPTPSFRPSDHAGFIPLDVAVALEPNRATATAGRATAAVSETGGAALVLPAAQNPAKTEDAVRKAFSKLGGTDYYLRSLKVDNPDGLFAPASALNELRRALVCECDSARAESMERATAAAIADLEPPANDDMAASGNAHATTRRILKLRADQTVPGGEWDEIVLAIGHGFEEHFDKAAETRGIDSGRTRLALPVFTKNDDLASLRSNVRRLVGEGCEKWEAADLAGLRMLRGLGVGDVTADWSLYAFNALALRQLGEMGVHRCVVSPEASSPPMESPGAPTLEFLARQSTPLFISLTRPEADDPSRLVAADGKEFTAFETDGLWITTLAWPRNWPRPESSGATRFDISWDPPQANAVQTRRGNGDGW